MYIYKYSHKGKQYSKYHCDLSCTMLNHYLRLSSKYTTLSMRCEPHILPRESPIAAELLQVVAHSRDAFSVVWYLLGARVSLQVKHPQISHPHKNLASSAGQLFNHVHSIPHTPTLPNPASGRTSGSQILLSWTSKVEIVVSTKWTRSSTPGFVN